MGGLGEKELDLGKDRMDQGEVLDQKKRMDHWEIGLDQGEKGLDQWKNGSIEVRGWIRAKVG